MAKTKIDREKQLKFIECYTSGSTAGNAKASAMQVGYTEKNSKKMGDYLKKKLADEIRVKQEQILIDNKQKILFQSTDAISVLSNLLHDESSTVKLNAVKMVLDYGNFGQQNLNVKLDKTENKSDDELLAELQELLAGMPNLSPELKKYTEIKKEKEEIEPEAPNELEKRVTH